ncbi:MAG TPA: SprT-like domain-containing protein [Terriglobia bacterium]|nr:SprT-like domain-containing protein [Terriglobia bacterium]
MKKKPAISQETITQAEYRAFQQAYDFFNAELFAGSLPPVLVTLQRHAKAYGYFSPERFVGRAEKEVAHELALNPDHFGRTDELILSVLVHEMAHVWQKAHGKMPRRGYHDRQWAQMMKQIGLQPSDTAQPGGKETGQHMGHYIIEGGPFAVAFAKLQATGFTLRWQSRMEVNPTRKAKKASKTKFTCPECAQNAWAKPDALLICGACADEDEEKFILMLAESEEETEAA